MRSKFLVGAFLLSPILAVEPATAEQVPERYLDNAYKNCLITARPGIGDLAEPYCSCMKKRLRIEFTKEQFERLDREAQARTKANGGSHAGVAEQMPRLKAVGVSCLQTVRGDT